MVHCTKMPVRVVTRLSQSVSTIRFSVCAAVVKRSLLQIREPRREVLGLAGEVLHAASRRLHLTHGLVRVVPREVFARFCTFRLLLFSRHPLSSGRHT